MGIFDKGVKKTNLNFFQKLGRAITGKSRVDDDVLDALEEALLSSDMGVDTTLKVIENIEDRVEKDKYVDMEELTAIIRDEIAGRRCARRSLRFHKEALRRPGCGRKRRGQDHHHRQARFHAREAGQEGRHWRSRHFPCRRRRPAHRMGPALRGRPCETAHGGRSKIRNVIKRVVPDGPHEVLLVLDGSTGQNAFVQAKEFSRATDVTALAVTKLDGSAKGGVVVGIVDQFKFPIKFLGIGEGVEDLKVFDKKEFVEDLFKLEDIEK